MEKINLSKDVKRATYTLLKRKVENMRLANLIDSECYFHGLAMLNAYRANDRFKMHTQVFEHAIDFSNKPVP